jgi:hypothetical protein
MEKKQYDLDNFFRENLSDFELSEKKKDGNWELLNHLLNEQERKKKRRRWFFLIFSAVTLLGSGLYIMIPGQKGKQIVNSKTEQSKSSSASEKVAFRDKLKSSLALKPSDKKESNKDEVSTAVQKPMPVKNIYVNPKKNPSSDEMNQIESHSDLNNDAGIEITDTDKPEANLTSIQSVIHVNDSDKTFIADKSDSDSLALTAVPNDSIPAVAINKLIDDTVTKEMVPAITKFLQFNLFAGINIYEANSVFRNNKNLSAIGGVELLHRISSKFSIGLAGLYSSQGGYNLYDTAGLIEITYFLDKEEFVSRQTIQIKELHKLYFPITFYCDVAKKHSVLAAIQFSYLLNTTGNFTEMYTAPDNPTALQKNNVKGYMDGINSTNISLSFGYKYSLSKRFDMLARFTRELKEQYKEDYFYGVSISPSFSMQSFLIVKF